VQLSRGDRVALLVPGSPAYLDAVLSLLVRGIVPIPLDPRLTDHERARVLADLAPALVVTDEAGVPALATGWSPGDVPLARPVHGTRGTTGAPKGVWSGVLAPDQAEALLAEERDLWRFVADDVNLVLSPLHHSAPLRFAVGTLLAGGRVVGLDAGTGFDAARITENLGEDLSVDTLARQHHMSPRTFARRFRAETGTTPHQWVTQQRVRAAEELLELTDHPVEWIAGEVGFGNAATLRHHFARVRGLSPQQYRRRFAG
jgi:AraC-like DNA-binding protein